MKTPYSEEDWALIETSPRKVADKGICRLLQRLNEPISRTKLDAPAQRALDIRLMKIVTKT
jgi:hypothetical protein